MKQTISFYDFERAFADCGRADQFSYEGKRALFDWIEELDDSCGTETELDVIALCCEFTEYDDLNEFNCDYDNNWSLGDISDHTTLIDIPDEHGFIIQQF